MSLSSRLQSISQSPSDGRYSQYESEIHGAVQKKDSNNIDAIFKHLIQVESCDQYGRTYIVPDLLQLLLSLLLDEENKNPDPIDVEDITPIIKKVVDMLRSRGEDFPDALMMSIDLLSKCYQAEEEYQKAAYALASFKFEDFRGKCNASSEFRVQWYLNCSEFFLVSQEIGQASQQVKKAHAIINECKNPSLLLKFKTLYARVLDQERKFLEAALRYMELSQLNTQAGVTEQDLLQSLEYAITCAILSKAGAPRSRVLSLLYSDSRSKQLRNYDMLERMYLERIIRQDEMKKFESMLQPHQKADTSNKRTILHNSCIEHNILACSKLYLNISLEQLSKILGITVDEAERVAADMIEQGRLKAALDQVDGSIEFQDDVRSSLVGWDHSITDVCLLVNRVVDQIQAKYPQYR